MALELIQNADDAKAEEIVFDITDQGLLVRNSSEFTYCGDLSSHTCDFQEREGISCDYHRITEVASGGKLSRGENIGRFGIGFVSTYQITDHPEVRSGGIKLTLFPASGEWVTELYGDSIGTSLFLPWASDPNTTTRRALGVSHVSPGHLNQLSEDFQAVLREGLLFLRHVSKAEVRRNGELLLGCDLDRGESSDLIVSFRPTGDAEHWYILRADAVDEAEALYQTHPNLKSLRRSTEVSIGLRTDPKALTEGYLYAFLPTEQLSGLPAHVNADFFPEADRKAVIFAGHQHQQAWNEMLIDVAAKELARDPEDLLQKLGHNELWRIFSRAFELSKSRSYPDCFSKFWQRMLATGSTSRITPAQDGTTQLPDGVMLPKAQLSPSQVKALEEIGGRIVLEELRAHQNAMNQLGAPILTLDRLAELLSEFCAREDNATFSKVASAKLKRFYQPLWRLVDDLLPENAPRGGKVDAVTKKLLSLPFLVTEDGYRASVDQSYLVPLPVRADKVTTLLPKLEILSRYISDCQRIARLVDTLTLDAVAAHLAAEIESASIEETINVHKGALSDLYDLLAELDRSASGNGDTYQALRELALWKTSKGLVTAQSVLLPGNFTDPTGHANLLDMTAFTDLAREFVSRKLGVMGLTIEAFVKTVLPSLFDDRGPLEPARYQPLMIELAKHPELINDEESRKLLSSLPVVPTQDGCWSTAANTYRRSEGLAKILGDAKYLWVDSTRLPTTRSAHVFIDSLGIRTSPAAKHLFERMRSIAEQHNPSDSAVRASSEAFYVLCEKFEKWKDQKSFKDELAKLRGIECFPAEDNSEQWFCAAQLHAPYRAEAFRSQARILAFKNTARMDIDFLAELGMAVAVELETVVDHLLHCAEKGIAPHVSVYQVLNEGAQKDDPALARLNGRRCVYVESLNAFVRPNQIYWVPQQLGKYAFTIPSKLELFKPLFTAIGVKNVPAAADYIDLILDIVGQHFEQGKSLSGADRAIYEACLAGVSAAIENEHLDDEDLSRLREAPTVLNLRGEPRFPDEVVIQNSEWHASFFDGEMDQALCSPAPELLPVYEAIGARNLSDCADVSLDFTEGEAQVERGIPEKLKERSNILARLLGDKQSAVRMKIEAGVAEMTCYSYDAIRIQSSVDLGGAKVAAPPLPAHAFYDVQQRQLVVARPISERSWFHVLKGLFHQLMPEESGSEISKLALSLRPLMSMSVDEAHEELTDAGIPAFTPGNAVNEEELLSREIKDFGDVDETQHEDGEQDAKESGGPEGGDGEDKDKPGATNQPGNDEDESQQGKQRTKRRPEHKEQWDRRLLSYVRKRPEKAMGGEGGSQSQHNLAVEAVARDAVCDYEKQRGRKPEQMPQTHPGYDIVSSEPMTGNKRFIEVKGVNGGWNQTGVGLSRLQFSNAQEFDDRYWLYVVEWISDQERLRVYPICSPAMQVTSFMFDGNWRDAAVDEQVDEFLLFYPGVRISHTTLGHGNIVSIEQKGDSRLLTIDFDDKGRVPNVLLDLHKMQVVEEEAIEV
jgi:hypothetical protein